MSSGASMLKLFARILTGLHSAIL